MKVNSLLAGTLALVLIAGLGSPAFAGEVPEPDPITEPGGETITFEFGILVTDIEFSGEDEGISSIQVLEEGDVIPGTLTFDAGMPDQNPGNPDIGIYPHDQVSLNIDGTIFEQSNPFEGTIDVFVDGIPFGPGGSIYQVSNSVPSANPDSSELAVFLLRLVDIDETVFDDDSLPLTAPNLDDFDETIFNMLIFPDGEIPLGASLSSPEDLALIDTFGEAIFIEGEIIFFINPIDTTPVAGELLPIDSAALLLAGAQTNALWIMSALAVIGSVAFGALYITSKKN